MHISKKYNIISDLFKHGIENNKELSHKMYLIVKIRKFLPRQLLLEIITTFISTIIPYISSTLHKWTNSKQTIDLTSSQRFGPHLKSSHKSSHFPHTAHHQFAESAFWTMPTIFPEIMHSRSNIPSYADSACRRASNTKRCL